MLNLAAENELALVVPPPALCTDNGAMIAWAGAERLAYGCATRLTRRRAPAGRSRRLVSRPGAPRRRNWKRRVQSLSRRIAGACADARNGGSRSRGPCCRCRNREPAGARDAAAPPPLAGRVRERASPQVLSKRPGHLPNPPAQATERHGLRQIPRRLNRGVSPLNRPRQPNRRPSRLQPRPTASRRPPREHNSRPYRRRRRRCLGTALANAIARAGRTVTLVARDVTAAGVIRTTRESPHLPAFHRQRVAIAALSETPSQSDAILTVVPAQTLRSTLSGLARRIAAGTRS